MVPWQQIWVALVKAKVCEYLVGTVRSDLDDRRIIEVKRFARVVSRQITWFGLWVELVGIGQKIIGMAHRSCEK